MAKVFDKLGQTVLPKVFEKLSSVGLTDLMDIKGTGSTAGTGGGRIKATAPIVYEDIPVVFETRTRGYKPIQGDQLVSTQEYRLKFPTHDNYGARINVDPVSHRLHVKARHGEGDEPAKVFRIIAMEDFQGNLFEATCIKEN